MTREKIYKNVQNITGYYHRLGRQIETAGEIDANALAQLYLHYHYHLYFYPASINNVTDCFIIIIIIIIIIILITGLL